MSGAVLRVCGSKSGVARFLVRTSWKPLTVYWKGEPRFKASTRKSRVNGFNVSVSPARGVDLARQILDARRFLRRNAAELRRVRRLGLSAVLDFGVEVLHETGPTYFRFPRDFVAALATHGIELELSYYGEAPE